MTSSTVGDHPWLFHLPGWRPDGNWHYPPLDGALKDAGLSPISEYSLYSRLLGLHVTKYTLRCTELIYFYFSLYILVL